MIKQKDTSRAENVFISGTFLSKYTELELDNLALIKTNNRAFHDYEM